MVTAVASARSALSALHPRLLAFPDREFWLFDADGAVEKKTYRQVHADVARERDRLVAAGVRPGIHVGILAGNSYAWVVADLALLAIGAVSVAFAVEDVRPLELETLKEQYQLGLLLISAAELETRAVALPTWGGVLGGSETGTFDGPPTQVVGADVFGLAFSSGTSGRPKAIMMSAAGTIDAIEEYHAQLGLRRDDAILVVLPLSAFPQRLMVFLAIIVPFIGLAILIKWLLQRLMKGAAFVLSPDSSRSVPKEWP